MSVSEVMISSTGRANVTDALAWIAEDRPLRSPASYDLLRALLAEEIAGLPMAEEALRRVSRDLLRSDIDTSVQLFGVDRILGSTDCDAVIDALVAHSPTGKLSGVGAAALASVLAVHPHTVLVYLQIAGISWSEARRRSAVRLPSDHDGTWGSGQLTALVKIVNDAVDTGARPPIENLGATGSDAWATSDTAATSGVSYGTLLAQRISGGSWIAHQMRTANDIRLHLSRSIASTLDGAGLTYSTTLPGHPRCLTKTHLSRLAARSGTKVGQLAFVVENDSHLPAAAVLIAVAQDGGTARKTGATLLRTPAKLKVPAYLVVAGPGWAERSESDALVRTFDGNVFTDSSLELLASTLADRNGDTS
ncbi:hypothetical protein [Microbacterium hydrocarbonoxydans]|uniref:hypothetical protein n=1 Tax=Microbacterium hydrocarbonoxydans TaxID=273678 RepID=UPI003D974CD0